MIRIQGKIPRKVSVACSGGVDSVAVADFLSKNHEVDLIFVDHLTEASRGGKNAVKSLYETGNFNSLHIMEISEGTKPKDSSWEEWWRDERYRLFDMCDGPIVTCHHLNDCVETWIWSSMHGNGKIIPYDRGSKIIRPFRLTKKAALIKYARDKGLEWSEDPDNSNNKRIRNYIRHEMMPCVLTVNPGIFKTVMKKVKGDFVNE